MNKNHFLLSALLIFLMTFSYAQTVQWASRVLDFSSQKSETAYSARQVLGAPDVMPKGGQSPCAWEPAEEGKEEFIKVVFDKPMQIRQIVVAESFNAGAIAKVYAFSEKGKKYEIYIDKVKGEKITIKKKFPKKKGRSREFTSRKFNDKSKKLKKVKPQSPNLSSFSQSRAIKDKINAVEVHFDLREFDGIINIDAIGLSD